MLAEMLIMHVSGVSRLHGLSNRTENGVWLPLAVLIVAVSAQLARL